IVPGRLGPPLRPQWLTALGHPLAACLALHALFLALYLSHHHGDVSALACVGKERLHHFSYRLVTPPLGPLGPDGQFYYALAQAPWQCHADDLDLPAARHLRIVYPALCWLLTAGDGRLLFYIMPAVNLAAILALTALGSRTAVRYGRSPWWGVLLAVGVNS